MGELPEAIDVARTALIGVAIYPLRSDSLREIP